MNKIFTYNSNYDDLMDEECLRICNYLNSLPTLKTLESCCGHNKDVFKIFLICSDYRTLSFLGRCIDPRYFKYGHDVEMKLSNSDTIYDGALFEFCTIKEKGEKAYKIIENLCENMILHINHPIYMNHFIPNVNEFLLKAQIK